MEDWPPLHSTEDITKYITGNIPNNFHTGHSLFAVVTDIIHYPSTVIHSTTKNVVTMGLVGRMCDKHDLFKALRQAINSFKLVGQAYHPPSNHQLA